MWKMDDNVRIVLTWLMIFITISFISYQIINVIKVYDAKITERHIYTLKFPDGKCIEHTVAKKESEPKNEQN